MKSKKNNLTSAEKLKDLHWFLNNLIWIKDKQGIRVKFKFNGVQDHLFWLEEKYKKVVAGKSRKHGVSTYKVLKEFVKCIQIPGHYAVVASYDQKSANKIFDKVRFAKENLHPDIKAEINFGEETTSSLEIIHKDGDVFNNSLIEVISTARGTTPTSAHISELAKMEDLEKGKAMETMEGTIDAVAIGGTVSIESTFGLKGDLFDTIFWKAWQDLQNGEEFTDADYYPAFYNWQWDKAEIERAPHYSTLPEEMVEYKEKHNLSVKEIDFYYMKYKDAHSKSAMYRNYPTTVSEARQVFTQGAIFENELDLWYNNKHITKAKYDPLYPVYIFQDLGHRDTTAIIWLQKIQNELVIIDFYQNKNLPVEHYIEVIGQKPYRNDLIFLPHDAENTSYLNDRNARQYYTQAGFKTYIMKPSSEIDRIDAIRRRSHAVVFSSDNASELVEQLGRVRRRNEGDKKVIHDSSSDAFDAMGYAMLHIDMLDENYDDDFHVIE